MSVTFHYKNTWWNNLRVERNITHKELAEYFDTSLSRVGAWFSGQYIPDRADIYKLCDLFDVDYSLGEEKFIEANETWKSERVHGEMLNSTGSQSAEQINKRVSTIKKNHKEKEQTARKESITMDIFKQVYGKLPYELFTKFTQLVTDNDADTLKLIYGKVSYEEFRQIEKAINIVDND